MKTGLEIIAAERQRQIEQEGWTPEHDAEHVNDEMAIASICTAGLLQTYRQTLRWLSERNFVSKRLALGR